MASGWPTPPTTRARSRSTCRVSRNSGSACRCRTAAATWRSGRSGRTSSTTPGPAAGPLMMVPYTVSDGRVCAREAAAMVADDVFLLAADRGVWARLRPAPRRRALRRHAAPAAARRRDGGAQSARPAVQLLRRAAPRRADPLIGASATSAGIHDMHMTDIGFCTTGCNAACPPPDTKALRASCTGEQCTAAGFVCVWLRTRRGTLRTIGARRDISFCVWKVSYRQRSKMAEHSC